MPQSFRIAAIALVMTTTALAAGCSGSKSSGSRAGDTTAASGKPAATPTPTATAATGSSTPAAGASPAGGPGIGACSLATPADVAGIYGEKFGAGRQTAPGGYSSCLFPPPAGAVDDVSFTVAQGSQADMFFSGNEQAYSSSPVSGVGDKAFVSTDGGALGFEKGSTAILVHVVGFEKVTPSDLQAKQEAFAKLLASRIS